MRDALGDLNPSRNVARRMHELETDLRHARTQLRRHNKSPDTLGRWGLDTPAPAQQEEGWFITYLDMMTLLLVVMIVMLGFSGSLGEGRNPLRQNPSTPVATTGTPGTGAAETSESPENSESSEVTAVTATATAPTAAAAAAITSATTDTGLTNSATAGHGAGLLPGGLGLLPGQTALSDAVAVSAAHTGHNAPDSPPLPQDAMIMPGKRAGGSLAELYPGWGSGDLSASFVGPRRPAAPVGTLEAAAETAITLPDDTANLPPTASAAGAEDLPTEGENLAAGMALGQLGDDVEVVVNERSVSFRVNSEILFDSSQADLSRPGLSVLRRILTVLADTNHDITVEGHTDSVPVRRNVRYPSNWELSSSRAGSVVRYLQANGIDKSRLKAIGYADTRPIEDNHTPDGRARNRRVELIIEKHD